MNRLPIQLLNSFVAFGESPTLVVAAKKLGLTQPGLSKHLQELEKKVGYSLYTQVGRNKVLSPLGRTLYLQLKSRFENIPELIEQTINTHLDESQVRIKISARSGIVERLASRIDFKGQIDFVESSNDLTLENLKNRKIDLGIVYSQPSTFEWVSRPLFTEQFHLVYPQSFGDSRRKDLKASLDMLFSKPFVGYGAKDMVLSELLHKMGLPLADLKILRSATDYRVVLKMVERSLGWSVVPSYLQIDHEKVSNVPLPKGLVECRKFYMVYRKEYSGVKWFRDLVTSLPKCFIEK